LIPEHAKAREPSGHILKVSMAFRSCRKTFREGLVFLNNADRKEHKSKEISISECTHSIAVGRFEIFQKQQGHMRFLLGCFEQQSRPGDMCRAGN
jgi:hypothetical protein